MGLPCRSSAQAISQKERLDFIVFEQMGEGRKNVTSPCWNCMSEGRKVRSLRTGIVYCAECGMSMDGLGAVTNFSVLDIEFVDRDDDEAEPSS